MAIEKYELEHNSHITKVCQSLDAAQMKHGIEELKDKYIRDICIEMDTFWNSKKELHEKRDLDFKSFFNQLKSKRTDNKLRQKTVKIWETVFNQGSDFGSLVSMPSALPIRDPERVNKVIGHIISGSVEDKDYPEILFQEVEENDTNLSKLATNSQAYHTLITTLKPTNILDKLQAKLLLEHLTQEFSRVSEEIDLKKDALFWMMEFIENKNLLDGPSSRINDNMNFNSFSSNKWMHPLSCIEYIKGENAKFLSPLKDIAGSLMNIASDHSYNDSFQIQRPDIVNISVSETQKKEWLLFLTDKYSHIHEYYNVIVEKGLGIRFDPSKKLLLKLLGIRKNIEEKVQNGQQQEQSAANDEIEALKKRLND